MPYNVKLEKLSKDFLFSIRYKLIAFIKPVVYTQLYDLYRKNFWKCVSKLEDYAFEISPNIMNKIRNFIPVKNKFIFLFF